LQNSEIIFFDGLIVQGKPDILLKLTKTKKIIVKGINVIIRLIEPCSMLKELEFWYGLDHEICPNLTRYLKRVVAWHNDELENVKIACEKSPELEQLELEWLGNVK
jgi:hypothetical protein